MEIPTLQINETLKAYLSKPEKDEFGRPKPVYKTARCCNYRYSDGTMSISVAPNEELKIGDDFRDYIHKGGLRIITEVVSYRPHRGIFPDESKRQKIAIVKSELITGV